MKKSFLTKQKIKLKYFFRSLSLSRANNAELSQNSTAKFLRKVQKIAMLEGVVDPKMRGFHGIT